MSFTQQFVSGIGYRSQFDPAFKLETQAASLLHQTFADTATKSMQEPFFSLRQRICSLALNYAAEQTVAAYSYQCLADSHTFLKACLNEKKLHEKYMTLTVGDVSHDGERLFGTTRQTLQQAVDTGISTADTPRFHVWLTLVDMTVIDLTLMAHLLGTQRIAMPETKDQWLTIWHPGRKGRLDYHPILIDDDFLSRLQRPAH